MNFQAPYRKSSQAVILMAVGIIFSLAWWVLATIGDHSACSNITLCLISVLGGFLPAAIGLLLLKIIKWGSNLPLEVKPGRMLAFSIYPILITFLFLLQMMMDQPILAPDWFYQPGVLMINLMAVLLIGPIGDSLGVKDRVINWTEGAFPTKGRKWLLMFTWWVWHLPFVFINGSALVALNFPNILLAAYLLTILIISWLMSWISMENASM
jgi:hypothetical protein